MKKLTYIFSICLLAATACDDKEAALPGVEAEIMGHDFTRWICGGGFFIRTDTDTFAVHSLPNEEVQALVDAANFNLESPIPVYITVTETPESSCAANFDNVKELSSISLRE